jgi:hypothetical protein
MPIQLDSAHQYLIPDVLEGSRQKTEAVGGVMLYRTRPQPFNNKKQCSLQIIASTRHITKGTE